MPFYEVITPLRNGGPEPVPTGETVELSKKEGDGLVAIGALAPGKKPGATPKSS